MYWAEEVLDDNGRYGPYDYSACGGYSAYAGYGGWGW